MVAMSRRIALGIGLALAAGAAATGGLAASETSPAHVARPNPALAPVRLDYINPLRTPDGRPATLAPLRRTVIAHALADHDFLAYQRRDDLGGFLPAPIGRLAFSGGGRALVGLGPGRPQIPQFERTAEGRVSSFAFLGEAPTPPPDNGRQPLPGVGVPPLSPPPGQPKPPPNQGFGGHPTPPPTTPTETGGRPGPPPTTTRTTPTPPTTTTTPTTTGATTTATVTTTPPAEGGGSSSGGGGGASCGTAGLVIESDLPSCRIVALNMAPGGAAYETLTIRNESGGPFTLSLRAAGNRNRLWDDLRMGVWELGSGAPDPLPPLLWWTAQDNDLAILPAGGEITLKVELFLPASAGNEDQNLAAVIDLVWKARG